MGRALGAHPARIGRVSLRYSEAVSLRDRWRKLRPCTCENGVVPCPSCVDLFGIHARGGWWAVAEALGDLPPQHRRSCCE